MLHVVLVAIVAYLQGVGIANVASGWVARLIELPSLAAAPAANPTRAPEPPEDSAPRARRRSSPIDPRSAPPCDGIDVSIVTESDDGSWSLATIRHGSGSGRTLARVGGRVARGRVAYVGTHPTTHRPTVWIARDGRLCRATMGAARPSTAHVAERERASAHAATPPLGLRGTRVVPVLSKGTIEAFHLASVPPHSILRQLGLRPGDRLEAVDGIPVANVARLLRLVPRLRQREKLTLSLRRDGAPITISINLS